MQRCTVGGISVLVTLQCGPGSTYRVMQASYAVIINQQMNRLVLEYKAKGRVYEVDMSGSAA